MIIGPFDGILEAYWDIPPVEPHFMEFVGFQGLQ